MRIVVVGTGTDVGKTHLGVALVSALARRGVSVCGLKPVESGVPAGAVGADGAALAQAGTFHVKHPQPYTFTDPVSPHLAARRQGVTIEMDQVGSWVASHDASWVLVETAGGLLSPLSAALTNLDLAEYLAPDAWLLVGVDRLGVLHDVAACRLAMRTLCRPAPPRTVVVLQAPAVTDHSTGTNAPELRLRATAEPVLVMPRGEPASPECQKAAEAILECFT